MESLRWILIAAGIVFILAIYVLGKKRSQRASSSHEFEMGTGHDADMDMPDFSARSLDDVDEGVGEVRVVSGGDSYDVSYDETAEDFTTVDLTDDDSTNDYSTSDGYVTASQSDIVSTDTLSNDNNDSFVNQQTSSVENNQQSNVKPNDIIVVYILPKAQTLLSGSQINSSALALGLRFGEMNIFHYAANGRNVFSLANMVEPGSFDEATIQDLQTSGLTLFMQITGRDPMDDLTEMLQRSYQLAGLLEARLCNHKREPLTEQDAENYRSQVRAFAA